MHASIGISAILLFLLFLIYVLHLFDFFIQAKELMKSICSIILLSYSHILFLPFLMCSFYNLNNNFSQIFEAIILLLMTIFIEFCITILDFEEGVIGLHYIRYDYLARKNSNFFLLLLINEIILCAINNVDSALV